MNVIILASDLGTNVLNIGKVTNVDRTVRILNLYGFKKHQIFIVGAESQFSNREFDEYVNFIDCEFDSKYRSSKPFLYAVSKLEAQDCLVINSDLVLDTNDLDNIIVDEDIEASLFVRRVKTINEKGLFIGYKNEKLVVSEKIADLTYPCYVYQGLSFVKKLGLENLSDDKNITLAELIISKLSKIKLVDFSKEIDGLKATGYRTRDLKGGSYASLEKRLLIRKDARGEGVSKLVDEIKWLENLDDDISYKFPKVIDSYISEDYSWFDMPYYDLPNLRKCLLSGYFNEIDFKVYINKILSFVFDEVYSQKFQAPKSSWMHETHYDRVYTRLNQLESRAGAFQEILSAEYVYINGLKYKNLRDMIQSIEASESINNIVRPSCLYRIHGDLHFQNMLIDKENDDFILADPRGEMEGSDIFYDMGKLWHSVNGLYDLIHTDIAHSEMNITNNIEIKINYGSDKLLVLYSNLKAILLESLNAHETFSSDVNAVMKMEFNEVMHFSSVMPFHIMNNGDENRAISLYCSSVIIANDFCKKYL